MRIRHRSVKASYIDLPCQMMVQAAENNTSLASWRVEFSKKPKRTSLHAPLHRYLPSASMNTLPPLCPPFHLSLSQVDLQGRGGAPKSEFPRKLALVHATLRSSRIMRVLCGAIVYHLKYHRSTSLCDTKITALAVPMNHSASLLTMVLLTDQPHSSSSRSRAGYWYQKFYDSGYAMQNAV